MEGEYPANYPSIDGRTVLMYQESYAETLRNAAILGVNPQESSDSGTLVPSFARLGHLRTQKILHRPSRHQVFAVVRRKARRTSACRCRGKLGSQVILS